MSEKRIFLPTLSTRTQAYLSPDKARVYIYTWTTGQRDKSRASAQHVFATSAWPFTPKLWSWALHGPLHMHFFCYPAAAVTHLHSSHLFKDLQKGTIKVKLNRDHPSIRSLESSSPPFHLRGSYNISEQLSSLFETAYYQQRGSLALFLFLAVDSQRILRLVFLFTQYIQSSVTTCSNFLFLNRQDLALNGVTGRRAAWPHHQTASRWVPSGCSAVRKKDLLPFFLLSEFSCWNNLCGILLFYFANPLLLWLGLPSSAADTSAFSLRSKHASLSWV